MASEIWIVIGQNVSIHFLHQQLGHDDVGLYSFSQADTQLFHIIV